MGYKGDPKFTEMFNEIDRYLLNGDYKPVINTGGRILQAIRKEKINRK